MKWFHHECAARYDSKLQILGSKHGAEGIGIYWGLLEEIGQHSDTFHLKVIGVDDGIDQKFSEFLQNSKKSQEVLSELPPDPTRIPVVTLENSFKKSFHIP